MKLSHSTCWATALCLAALSANSSAQANQNPGINVKLGVLGSMKYWGRQGTFPTGVSGFSMSTTSCNIGTVDVPWHAPMASNHPTISFIVARVKDGRLVQVSDASYLKHGFYALSDNDCTPCQNPSNGTYLGVGCSDTYDTNNNGDHYYLGPPEEIDPWLGTWNPACSHFDRGEPPVAPPFDCDGFRSLTSSQANALGPVGHRIRLNDADLNVTGATFWYQAQYNIRSEPEAVREDDLGSRGATFTWTGSAWNVSTNGSLLAGSVLKRWSGSSLSSGVNGGDDGRVYVAVKSSPISGGYHYEYAVHNRDNARGVGQFRVPISPGTSVTAFGFHDVDGNASNDWTMAVGSNEVVFSTPSNPILWNTIYNFWFDASTGPGPANVAFDAFFAGGGAPSFSAQSEAPVGACPSPAVYCTPKVSSQGCTPAIAFSGNPSATAGFGFFVTAGQIVEMKNGLFFYSKTGANGAPFQGGTLCVKSPLVRTGVQSSGGSSPCGGSFWIDFNVWIASGQDPALVLGQPFWGQYWYRDPADPFTTGLTDAVSGTVCP